MGVNSFVEARQYKLLCILGFGRADLLHCPSVNAGHEYGQHSHGFLHDGEHKKRNTHNSIHYPTAQLDTSTKSSINLGTRPTSHLQSVSPLWNTRPKLPPPWAAA